MADERPALTVDLLLAAIRKHRDQRGDDRCWMDDQELYEVLPEGLGGADLRLCGAVEMLKNCTRFVASRHDPAQPYISSQRRIEELENGIRLYLDGNVSDRELRELIEGTPAAGDKVYE